MKRVLLMVTLLSAISSTTKAFSPIYSLPPFEKDTNGKNVGYQAFGSPYHVTVSNSGFAVGAITYYSSNRRTNGPPVMWNADEFKVLGDAAGKLTAINDMGAVAGWSIISEEGEDLELRAARWDAGNSTPTVLEDLITAEGRIAYGSVSAINNQGTTIGRASLLPNSGVRLGGRAFKWSAGQTNAEILEIPWEIPDHPIYNDPPGIDIDRGLPAVRAYSINDAGTVVGTAGKFDENGISIGGGALRWNPGQTVAEELGHLGTSESGTSSASANIINSSGTTAGTSWLYDAEHKLIGTRPVRWDAGSTEPVELEILGTDSKGSTFVKVVAINDAGTVAGRVSKYDAQGNRLGSRAVFWDAVDGSATELAGLGEYSYGEGIAGINESGAAVGNVANFTAQGVHIDYQPVVWGVNGKATNINDFVDPESGWHLTQALSISDTGWIGGIGEYDPDGEGGQAMYIRPFLMQIPNSAVPEPSSVILIVVVGGISLLYRNRR